ncbi:putative 37s ribosomal protein mrp10 protein [Phaeoacremonium minimum UCRPA7]|uniref:Putative 37s ribosomal protein mrp10 protein n=1 Tax=Phaeoacremonium minimum (strain UCR-PA7) TaxID=1286976 RepID=R8BQV4_PHAM7|nr:putative 37s ribosomal protein mrp10 protein [Phaeoacremonium minimum UCRPA7]EOO01736.1 putative 37s ribosomal protein mrp10 protein [Phaeoacremonium minimum UCRPA7]
MSSVKKPMRLPPLRTLRVRNPNQSEGNPCVTIMSSVLGYNTAGCAVVEQALRQCMDSPPPTDKRKNTVNYHLARMQKYIEPKRKHK